MQVFEWKGGAFSPLKVFFTHLYAKFAVIRPRTVIRYVKVLSLFCTPEGNQSLRAYRVRLSGRTDDLNVIKATEALPLGERARYVEANTRNR